MTPELKALYEELDTIDNMLNLESLVSAPDEPAVVSERYLQIIKRILALKGSISFEWKDNK